MMTDSNNPGGGGGGGQPAGDSHSIELGFDLQEAVTQRLAQRNKKAVQLSDLLTSTKFTKQEICTMYRGFKQVKRLFLHSMLKIVLTAFKSMQCNIYGCFMSQMYAKHCLDSRGKPDRTRKSCFFLQNRLPLL